MFANALGNLSKLSQLGKHVLKCLRTSLSDSKWKKHSKVTNKIVIGILRTTEKFKVPWEKPVETKELEALIES